MKKKLLSNFNPAVKMKKQKTRRQTNFIKRNLSLQSKKTKREKGDDKKESLFKKSKNGDEKSLSEESG